MKKILFVLMLVGCLMFSGCGNYDVFDMQFTFDYAYIELPNGEIVEGKIQQRADYEGDQLQIKIDGVIYLVHSENAVMIAYD